MLLGIQGPKPIVRKVHEVLFRCSTRQEYSLDGIYVVMDTKVSYQVCTTMHVTRGLWR